MPQVEWVEVMEAFDRCTNWALEALCQGWRDWIGAQGECCMSSANQHEEMGYSPSLLAVLAADW